MTERERQDTNAGGVFRALYFNGSIPTLTVATCAISGMLFLLANIKSEQSVAALETIVPSAIESVDGKYWGLISSNFLHFQFWHIFFNLSWIWHLGKYIEQNERKLFYIWLVLSSALVSSLSQMSVSDSFGVGLSGVVYAMFGYILIRNKTRQGYELVMEKRTVHFFFIWLVACVVLTQLDILPVANAGHAGGLIWGLVLGSLTRFHQPLQWAAGALVMSLYVAWLIWSPFTTLWLMRDAFRLHDAQRLDEALVVYNRILEKDSKNETARLNKKQLEIYKLQQQVEQFYNKKRYKEAREALNKILAIDPENEAARQNLSIIPQ